MARSTKPISNELRWAIVNMHFIQELPTKTIHKYTNVSERSIQRILKLFRMSANILPHKRHTGRALCLSLMNHQFLEGCLEQSSDAYLDELAVRLEETCGVKASRATIWRALRRMGFTLKKISRRAMEQSEDWRLQYLYRIGSKYEANQLVFVDESSFDRRTSYRGRAWALRGRRAVRKCFFVRGKRYSVLPALSLDGILWCKIIEGAYNVRSFTEFISELLESMQPYPNPNSVIVMDNASIHKDPATTELIRARGMRVEFLPAYSPDLNPIEEAFSAMKAHFRRHHAYFARINSTGTDPADAARTMAMLLDIVFSISPEHAHSYFHHSNYI